MERGGIKLGRALFVGALLVSLAVVLTARAAPVLHEYFEPDAHEDLRLGATTADGRMAAAMRTQSGVVAAPDPESALDPSQSVYGGASNAPPDSPEGSRYRADANTTQPDVVRYDDPFTPSMPPFKRMFAYDAVDESFQLFVRNTELHELETEGEALPEDDQFYANLQLETSPGVPVRIPSVGPGARVLVARSQPDVPFRLWRDGADNCFVTTEHTGTLRLIVQLAIDRRVFGSDWPDVSYAALAPALPPVPPKVRSAARDVASQIIGLSLEESPKDLVAGLVSYFRGFAPAEPLHVADDADLYVALCRSRAGVCRHRAFAFVVTALGLGIPARFVRNEAHAWVEVFDSIRWQRIDLGGAASRVSLSFDDRPTHVTPNDPYSWPPGSNSGRSMVERARRSLGQSSSDDPQSSSQSSQSSNASSSSPDGADTPPPDNSNVARSEVHIETDIDAIFRGQRFKVAGAVMGEERPCSLVRVDLSLMALNRALFPLGTLVTDSEGHYEGTLVVPHSVPVGNYEVVARTPGRQNSCGPGSSTTSVSSR